MWWFQGFGGAVFVMHRLWYSWRHQMAALHATGQWDVVALDMRGYNLSDKPRVGAGDCAVLVVA